MASLMLEAEVVGVPGLGQLPGVLAFMLATVSFSGAVWVGLRRGSPTYWAVLPVAAATFLAYLVGLLMGALFAGDDVGPALSAVSDFSTSWFAAVLAGSAVVSCWAAVALVRTRAGRPRWPWEDDADR